MVNNEERGEIIEFLSNPIEKGLWESKFLWSENDGVFSKLLIKDDDYLQQKSTPYNILLILDYLSKKNKEKNFHVRPLANEISSLVSKCEISDYDKYISFYEEEVESLYIGNSRIIINGKSSFVYQIPNYQNPYLKILSLNREANEKIFKIFKSLNYLSTQSVRKVYSPKDILINPFFVYVDIISKDLFEDFSQNQFFQESYKSFLSQEHENSMSKIGKLCEYTLTEIYETLFREFAPDGSTIGKLHSSIYSKVKKALENPKKKNEEANFDELYEKANNLKGVKVIDDLKSTIRLLAELLKKDQKFSKNILEKNDEEYSFVNIFPKHIALYLKKILNYRNSVAHNSGVYFGYIDNLKMLFYYISFHTWWVDTYSCIDWKKNETEIIKSIVLKSKKH